MRKAKFSIVLIALSLLVMTVSAQTPTGVLGQWRDINPSAYISPPANPPLNSMFMLSANEGWAVGDARPSTEANMSITTDVQVDVKQNGQTVTTSTVSSSVVGTLAQAKILYYDGATWNLVPAPQFLNPDKPSSYNLTSVTFGPPMSPISRNDGWAVGCTFDPVSVGIHWDGLTWSMQRAGLTTADAGCLNSAFMVSSTDVWAVGANTAGTKGVFWHWTGVPGLGGGWNEPQASVDTVFRSVFMVSPTEGWAVGRCLIGGCAGTSNIYHYFSGSWTAFPSPVTTPLDSIFMLSPTDGWIVGEGGVILHYTTGIWTGPVSPGTTTDDLLSVFMSSGTEGWASGKEGNLLHYSGGAWTKLPINLVPTSPTTDFEFRSIFLLTASNGWTAGTADVIGHWDGVNWGTLTSPTLNVLNSISFGPPLTAVNPDDGWAVGNSGPGTDGADEPTIIHWNGFMWTRGVAIGSSNNLTSVFMINTGDVWAVGGGRVSTSTCTGSATAICPTIMHFTGGSWNTVTPPSTAYVLNSVFMVSSSEGWAVGCSGTYAQCVIKTATGGSGIILHYTLTGGVGTWAIFPSPLTPPLNSIFMVGANEGWAVGDHDPVTGAATVLHYTVTAGLGTWNTITIGPPSLPPSGIDLNSVFLLSTANGWAVGGIIPTVCTAKPCVEPFFSAGPVIIHWDGVKWTRVAAPDLPGDGRPILQEVYFTAPNEGWAVGMPGILVPTIFHFDGIRWAPVTLSPALLGISPPTVPPTLNSVYMTSPSGGWIVGSPTNFDNTVISGSCGKIPPIPCTKPLATILRYSLFGGVLAGTSTTTFVSTASTLTTAITTASTVLSIISSSVTTTITSTATVSGGGIPGFPLESILAGITVGLVTLMILRRKRTRSRSR